MSEGTTWVADQASYWWTVDAIETHLGAVPDVATRSDVTLSIITPVGRVPFEIVVSPFGPDEPPGMWLPIEPPPPVDARDVVVESVDLGSDGKVTVTVGGPYR